MHCPVHPLCRWAQLIVVGLGCGSRGCFCSHPAQAKVLVPGGCFLQGLSLGTTLQLRAGAAGWLGSKSLGKPEAKAQGLVLSWPSHSCAVQGFRVVSKEALACCCTQKSTSSTRACQRDRVVWLFCASGKLLWKRCAGMGDCFCFLALKNFAVEYTCVSLTGYLLGASCSYTACWP